MIEILVTIAIVVIGLWGLMDVQTKLQRSEIESYQRSQALLLLNDMKNRMTVNRKEAADYVTEGLAMPYVGAGSVCNNAPSTIAQMDMADWCNSLQGASEVIGAGRVGALSGGRGCVQEAGSNQYMITVVWQGLFPTSPPPAEVSCGATLYDLPEDSDCKVFPESCRRYVTTMVRFGNLLETSP